MDRVAMASDLSGPFEPSLNRPSQDIESRSGVEVSLGRRRIRSAASPHGRAVYLWSQRSWNDPKEPSVVDHRPRGLAPGYGPARVRCGLHQEDDAPQAPPPELAKASRVDTNGWINVHLEGTPREIGFQHGWLLARRDRRPAQGARRTSSRARRSATGRSSGPPPSGCSGRSSRPSTGRRSRASRPA
ncbi:MAG: hypothetical protein MZU91_11710 [Desulfosudis oleivorans]|nr:hypothetical protein [Desulfosudis oleivorans]